VRIASHSVRELVDELVSLAPEAIDAKHVGDILAGVRPDDSALAPYLYWCEGRYTRNLLFRNERFELLALCWDRGSGSPIHDHGRSRCFMAVARGELNAEDYAIVEGGGEPGPAVVERVSERMLGIGDLDIRNPVRDVHRITATRERSVSLHVYAKPLDRCLVFDQPAQNARGFYNRYDTIRLITPHHVLVA
jgi:cysteine dioxygenase